ncbi:MAG: hypothetical protein JSU73_04455 [candidate division WOR-3 bacterium]|nr:MAG: hypothetical protein JSU73_04455 [candidate division WOR-3 bacterium]
MTGPDWVLRFTFVLVVVLVPLVPAYVLFRILKSTATLKGPFQGLTLNLGGAGALYFAILMLLFYTLKPWTAPEAIEECWTIEGAAVLDEPPQSGIMNVFVRARPPELDYVLRDTVGFEIPGAIPGPSQELKLLITADGYCDELLPIPLSRRDSAAFEYDDKTRTVRVLEPITLERSSDEQTFPYE